MKRSRIHPRLPLLIQYRYVSARCLGLNILYGKHWPCRRDTKPRGCAFTIGRIVKSIRGSIALEGERRNERNRAAFLPNATSAPSNSRPTDFSRAKRGMKRMETLRKMSIDSSGSNRVLGRFPTSV